MPLTLNEVNVPTEVIFACALAVTYCANPTLPVTLDPLMFVNPAPLPVNTLPVTLPVTLRSVITLPVKLILVVLILPEFTLPVALTMPVFTLALMTLPLALTITVLTLPEFTLPLTLKLVNVPTLVMLACALAVTYCANPTLPMTLDPLIFVNPEPLPVNTLPVTLPEALTTAVLRLPEFTLPLTLKLVSVPTLVMLACALAVT